MLWKTQSLLCAAVQWTKSILSKSFEVRLLSLLCLKSVIIMAIYKTLTKKNPPFKTCKLQVLKSSGLPGLTKPVLLLGLWTGHQSHFQFLSQVFSVILGRVHLHSKHLQAHGIFLSKVQKITKLYIPFAHWIQTDRRSPEFIYKMSPIMVTNYWWSLK